MKKKVIRIDVAEIENLHATDKPTPTKFFKRGKRETIADLERDAKAQLRIDFVNYIFSRLNDITLPYFTGKATRFELWVDDEKTNQHGEPQLSMRFWVPSPFPTIKRGLMSFEYPVN